MKRTANYLVWAALLGFAVGCQPFLTDPLLKGKPRIVAIQYPGILAEDISIDQDQQIIRIKMAELMPPPPQTAPLPDVKVAGSAFTLPSWVSIFTDDRPEYRKIDLYGVGASTDNQPPPVVATYKVELIPKGPLEIDTEALEKLTDRELGGSSVYVPFKNLYANDLPVQVRFMNRETKEISVIDSTSPPLFIDHNPFLRYLTRSWGTGAEQLNRLLVDVMDFGAKAIPGTYDVEFIMKDGRSLKLPRIITIVPSALKVNNWEQGIVPKVPPGGEFVFTGRNLFKGDFSITMRDSTDQVLEIQDLAFNGYGTEVKMKIPASARAGHYAVRIAKPSATNALCYLLHVSPSTANAPYEIFKIGRYFYDCSIKEPFVPEKNKEIEILTNGTASKIRLKMVAITDSNLVYYGSASLARPTDYGPKSTITIPGSIPQIKYRVSLQVLDEFGRVTQEGPPYWRLVQVK